MAQKWDVIIVGGGLAGFVAANYLAGNDLSILVIEKGKKVGGRANVSSIFIIFKYSIPLSSNSPYQKMCP